MNNRDFAAMLEQHPELKKDVFIRGFLITDKDIDDLSGFPFYGNWRKENHGGWFFLAHEKTLMHIHTDASGNVFFLMGHAYDPFAMEHRESAILKTMAEAYGTDAYMERVNDLTGIFVLGCIVDGTLNFLVDPAGIQSAACGKIGEYFYLTSHAQLVGDLCDLEMDPFVRELVAYKWYGRILGPYLPADLTPFASMKRVVPSNMYSFNNVVTHKRYWPKAAVDSVVDPEEYQRVIQDAADILRNNMLLITKKWAHPWISLTGGIDSNTTFAAANGNYSAFEAFSYVSAEKEVPDAAAARKIADAFKVTHHEYHIPARNDDMMLFREKQELFLHNNGYVAKLYDNEARKKFYLRENTQCDVEVKSWVSETIRGYWYKYYGRKNMPKLSPRLFRNLYKIFTVNRTLAHKIDRIFKEYIEKYEYHNIPEGYPIADLHYHEVSWGSWGSLNISEMKYCFDITIIYNNRRFLDLMFRVPLEKRISDQHHLDMKKYLNPQLYDLGIRVVNMHETKFRAFALNVIFTINSILPF